MNMDNNRNLQEVEAQQPLIYLYDITIGNVWQWCVLSNDDKFKLYRRFRRLSSATINPRLFS